MIRKQYYLIILFATPVLGMEKSYPFTKDGISKIAIDTVKVAAKDSLKTLGEAAAGGSITVPDLSPKPQKDAFMNAFMGTLQDKVSRAACTALSRYFFPSKQ